MAARELWKRLLPNRDQLDWFIDDWKDYQEKLKDEPEKKRTDADIPELSKMLDRLDQQLDVLSLGKGVKSSRIHNGDNKPI